jgi:uncharacterized membrane protein YhaH (DUF805 family)
MGFGQAISTCFSKYVTFQGRARRSEFWWWVLFIVIGSMIAGFLDGLFSTTYSFGGEEDVTVYTQTGWIGSVFFLVTLLPGISVAVRRLHDTDKSGWWWWLGFLCFIGWIVLFIFYVSDSGPDNRFGPNPKGSTLPPSMPGIPPASA